MISSFLQDIPRHDTRLFEVREAFKRTLLLVFAHILEHISQKKTPPATLPGGPPGGLPTARAPQALGRLLRSPQQTPDH